MNHDEHMKMASAANAKPMSMHMKMYFNTDTPFTLLFKPWEIDSVGKEVAAFIGLLVLSMLYEACSAVREHLLLKAACRDHCPPMSSTVNTTPLTGPSCPSCPISSPENSDELVDRSHGRYLRLRFPKLNRFFDVLHLAQTGLHLIQMFISYLLMLAVMTYNVYMFISILAGLTAGHFLFARTRPLLLRSPTCCHWTFSHQMWFSRWNLPLLNCLSPALFVLSTRYTWFQSLVVIQPPMHTSLWHAVIGQIISKSVRRFLPGEFVHWFSMLLPSYLLSSSQSIDVFYT